MQRSYYENRPEIITAARPPGQPRRGHGPLVYCLIFIGILGALVAIVCLALLAVLVSNTDRIKVVRPDIGQAEIRTKRQTTASDITYVFYCREDYEPYCYRDASGALVGLMKDAVDCACRSQSKVCKWVLGLRSDSWNYLDYSPVLTYGQAHAVCALYPSDSRSRSTNVFGQVYQAAGVQYYIRNTSASSITGSNVQNFKLGYAPASSANLNCPGLPKFATVIESRADNYMDDLIGKLHRGEVDVVLSNSDEKSILRQPGIITIPNSIFPCNTQAGGCLMAKNQRLNGCLGAWFENGLTSCITTIKQACSTYSGSRCISRFN